MATISITSIASAANIEGPAVFWKISMFGNPWALTSGMEALAEKAAAETDGKLQIKIFMQTSLAIHGKTWMGSSLMPLSVVVLDAGGRIVAVKSEDGSGIMRVDVALGKAWGALGMGISSRLIRDRLSNRPVFQTALSGAADGKQIPVPSDVLIEDEERCTIGSVGISGDTSEKDEYRAILAIKKAGLKSKPADVDPDWRRSYLSDK